MLKTFFQLMDRYEQLGRFPDDSDEVAYWCGERALVGMLSNAVAVLDGASLVEFEARDRRGRFTVPDLWFRLPNATSDRWLVEAKFEYVRSTTDLRGAVTDLCNEAAGQLTKLPMTESSDRRAAVVFISPTRKTFTEWKLAFERLTKESGARVLPRPLLAWAIYERDRNRPAVWNRIPHPGCMVFVFEV